MPTKFSVSRADFRLEAPFQRPQFALFRDPMGLTARMFSLLEPHGLRLSDLKLERGSGSAGDFHLMCSLFEYGLTVRVWLEKVEIVGVQLTGEDVLRKYAAAVSDALAISPRDSESSGYRTFGVAANLHGLLEGTTTKDYIAAFVAKTPNMMGAAAGGAIGYYYGPSADSVVCSLTLDVSALVPGGLYIRPQVTWDATKITPPTLPARTEGFVRDALSALELEVPQ